jgi:hypothetical protein
MITKLERLSTGGLMDKLPTKKVCSDCGQEKPLKQFRKNGKMKDGTLNRCQSCERSRLKEKEAKTDEYAKQYFVHTSAF